MTRRDGTETVLVLHFSETFATSKMVDEVVQLVHSYFTQICRKRMRNITSSLLLLSTVVIKVIYINKNIPIIICIISCCVKNNYMHFTTFSSGHVCLALACRNAFR